MKGAAAAAARARWAKVRLAKAERGDEDDGEPRKKGRIIRRENKAAVEKLKGTFNTMSRERKGRIMGYEQELTFRWRGNHHPRCGLRCDE